METSNGIQLRGLVKIAGSGGKIVAILVSIDPADVGMMEAKYRKTYAPKVLDFTWMKQPALHQRG